MHDLALSQVFKMTSNSPFSPLRLELMFGVDASGEGHDFSYSMQSLIAVAGSAIKLSGPPVPQGALLRLHVRDEAHWQDQLSARVQVCLSHAWTCLLW